VEPESVQFYVKNALKLTCEHLYLKNFPGVIPQTPVKEEGRKGRTEGKGGD
jgi:hypothetical protein